MPSETLQPKTIADAVAEGVSRAIRKWVLIVLAVYLPVWFAGQVLNSVNDASRQAGIAIPVEASPEPYQRTMTDAELEAFTGKHRRELQQMLGKRP